MLNILNLGPQPPAKDHATQCFIWMASWSPSTAFFGVNLLLARKQHDTQLKCSKASNFWVDIKVWLQATTH